MGAERHDTVIVGAGLVGSLLSIFLVRRGVRPVVFEGRPDPRASEIGGGRSINLVVTSRGLHALEQVGLREAVLAQAVPVLGRMVHSVDGEQDFQPYGRDKSERNYSISRDGLNRFLIDAAERAGARFVFEHRLIHADLAAGSLRFADSRGEHRDAIAARVYGTDGADSAVRKALVVATGGTARVDDLGHGYKELLIPSGPGGKFRIEQHALHIWPRTEHMMMALANLDGGFTVTLYLPETGPVSFASLKAPGRVREVFERYYADAIPLIPDLEPSYHANPTGMLATMRCSPWRLGDRALLLGDAAHAIVPFFGQGMNCGFEDCTSLVRCLDRFEPDVEAAFAEYERERKPNADAIADMSIENFTEMQHKVGDDFFVLRKRVEALLEQALPSEYRSRYSMVAYSRIPYRVAFEAGRIQQQILDELCQRLQRPQDVDLERARVLIRERLRPFMQEHSVAFDY